MRIRTIVGQFLDVPSTDPDDARRRKLLNILLLGVGLLAFFALVGTLLPAVSSILQEENQLASLQLATAIVLVAVMLVLALNRYGPPWLASSLFLLLITGVLALTDEPENVVNGRSMLLFGIPIVMASVVLPPYASFALAVLATLAHTAIAAHADLLPPNLFAIVAFFAFALVSWLAANTLERALRDLRVLNLELDQRVQERTRDLAESLSKTEAILDSTADGVIVFGNDGKATVANPAVAGLLAHQTDEIVGRDIETLMGDDVGVEDREMIGNLLEGGEMQEPSVKFEWGARTLSASVAPVQLASGEEIGTVAVFRDFTREAEIDRMKSSFVSIASHELRTPLNAIMGYSEMLKEGIYGPLSDKQHGATERILANTRHMLSLANNLLDRAQIEAGTLMLNVTPFSPSSLIDDVIGAMEVLARNKGLELTGDVADDVPAMLLGDQQRLDQVVVNLVGNAIKFTEEGKIGVRVYVHDATHWAIAVSDTGIGIPKEARSYIFEPFRQADESPTREHTGAGLGLSIVRQLVAMMGGEIGLESEVGKGSKFTVVLPLTTGEGELVTSRM